MRISWIKRVIIILILLILVVSLSAAKCPWFIRDELYSAQCGVIKVVPESQGILANDAQAVAVLNPESITIDPKYGSIKVAANGSFVYSPSPNIPQGTYVQFKYDATSAECKAQYPSTAKLQISCSCLYNIPSIDPICLPASLDDIRDILEEAGAGCIGCGDITALIDLSDVDLDKNGRPVAGTYSFCIDCSGTQSRCGQVILRDCAGDVPDAVDDTVATTKDAPVSGSLAGNDELSDDGGNTWSLKTKPAHGTASVNPDGTFTYTPSEKYCGQDSFIYTLADVDGDSDTAKVVITIECVNDIPEANDDTAATTKDAPVSGSLAGNDELSDDGGNTWSLKTKPAHGTASVNADGTFTYTPSENYCGQDSFIYTLTDIDGDSDTAKVVITIECFDDVPVANDDTASTTEDTPVSGSLAGNDELSDDGGNTWSLKTKPAHGTASVNADGTFTYTPSEKYCGQDSFTYTLTDTDGDFDIAKVVITIECVNDIPEANDDTAATTKDAPVSGSLAGNDELSDDGGNTWSLKTKSAHGTASVNADGTFTYTPSEKYCGQDSFTYTLTDTDGDFDIAKVVITIECVDDFPVANDDTASTTEDTPVSSSVSGNDELSDDGGNTWSKLTDPVNGDLIFNPDGSFTYTPSENYCGQDSFTYTLTDTDGDFDIAKVVITIECVDDVPVANDDTASTTEDTPVSSSVSGNDELSDDGGNTWSIKTKPAHGTASVNPDGTFTYTPSEKYCGQDNFIYTLTDVDGDSDTAKAVITIECVNDIPEANDDTAATTKDAPVSGSLAGNDELSDDGGNTWSMKTKPSHGTASVNLDGTFTYTPSEKYCGQDSFIYTLADTDGDSDTANVAITIECVNDIPEANDDTASTTEDTPVSVSLAGNDELSDDGGNTWSIKTKPAHGTASVNPDGTFTYTPSEKYCGQDSFTYTLTDTDGDFDIAKVVITIECFDDVPVANDDTASTTEDTPVSSSVSGNDELSDDGGNTWSKLTDPVNGDLIFNPDGSFTYTPFENYCGQDSFTYTLTDTDVDSDVDSDTASVIIIVECIDDAPIAVFDTASTCQDKPVSGSAADNDYLSEDGGNTWSRLTNPANGNVVFNDDGTFTYTPNAGWSGVDNFNYRICDDDGDCDQETVSITVVMKCNCELVSLSQDGCMYPDEMEAYIMQSNPAPCGECDGTPYWQFPDWPVDQTTGYVLADDYTYSVLCPAGAGYEDLEDCESTCTGQVISACEPDICPCVAYAEDITIGCDVTREDLAALIVADCRNGGSQVCDQMPLIDLGSVTTDDNTGFVTGGSYAVDCSPQLGECPTATGNVIVECECNAYAPDISLPIICAKGCDRMFCKDYSLPRYSGEIKQKVMNAGGACTGDCAQMSIVLPADIDWSEPGRYEYKVLCKNARGAISSSDTGRLSLDFK